MEIWDGYRKDGTLAGVDLVRGEMIPEGLYHLVCEILVRHRDGSFLLMQRDLRKEGWPGAWEATAGGSALKGENAQQCAKRELLEETGIESDCLQPIGRSVSHNTIYESYLCETDWAKENVSLQEGETIAFQWMEEADFIRFLHSGEMIPSQKKRYTKWFCHMGYME